MGQDQFRVRFSLKSKLLLSVVVLLLVVIGVLSASTIHLFTTDKRAYIYQVQGTEATLAGKEFANLGNRAIDTLRQSLGLFDPNQPIGEREKSLLQATLDNQSRLVTIQLLRADLNAGTLERLAHSSNSAFAKQNKIDFEQFEFPKKLFEGSKKELLEHRFAFYNISSVGQSPFLATLVLDLPDESKPGIAAIGLVSLKNFLKELEGTRLTIASTTGRMLYDSDPKKMFGDGKVLGDPLYSISLQNQLSSGAQEYQVAEEDFIGSYYKPGLNSVVLARVPWKEAMRATYYLTGKVILLSVAAVGIALLFSLIFAKTLTNPLRRLYNATKEVAAGKFNLNLKTSSSDEIGALSGSFNVMSQKIGELIEESMEKVRLQGELAIASTVQQTLIPPEKFESQNILIHSHYQSASECGGDWWGFFGVDDKVALFIADATGHGLPSALITAAARSCFSVMHKLAQESDYFDISPAEMLSYANRVVYDAATGKIMMTFFSAVIDFEDDTLTYASAGHNPPWLFQKNAGKYKMKSLTSKGRRLGEVPDLSDFQEKEIQLQKDDILFLYTDGIIEGKDLKNNQYGKKRMKKIIESKIIQGPEAIINTLMSDFNGHNGRKPLDDDVTLAAAKILS